MAHAAHARVLGLGCIGLGGVGLGGKGLGSRSCFKKIEQFVGAGLVHQTGCLRAAAEVLVLVLGFGV